MWKCVSYVTRLRFATGVTFERLITTVERNVTTDMGQENVGTEKEEDFWKLIKIVVELNEEELWRLKYGKNMLLQHLKIPPDMAKNIVTVEGLNEISKGVKKGVYVIVGEAGSGKTTLLYTLSERQRGCFPLDFFQGIPNPFREIDPRYEFTVLDVDSPRKAKWLKSLLRTVREPSKLKRVAIAIDPSYVDGELREYFKHFHVIRLKHTKRMLTRIAEKYSRRLSPRVEPGLLVERSEGLPAYIVEAVKYVKNEGKTDLPKGIRALIVRILELEIERLGAGAFLLYYIASHYPGIPEDYLKHIGEMLHVSGTPKYIDRMYSPEGNPPRLSLHSWYRIVTDDIAKYYEGDVRGLEGYEEVEGSLESIASALSTLVDAVRKDSVIDGYFQSVYDLFTSSKTVPEELKAKLREFREGFSQGKVKLSDLVDLVLLASLIDFVKRNVRKRSGEPFDVLKERIDYVNIGKGVKMHYALLSFLTGSYLADEREGPLYYATLLLLSRFFESKLSYVVEKHFLEGDNERGLTLKSLLYYRYIFRYEIYWLRLLRINTTYISALARALENLGYFRAETLYDRLALYVLREDYRDPLKEFATSDGLEHRVVRAVALYHAGSFDEALKELDEAIELDPKNPRLYEIKAIMLRKLKLYEDALKEIDKAVNIDPNNPEYHLERGHILAKYHSGEDLLQGISESARYEEAINEFNIAISLDPKDPRYHFAKADFLHQHGIREELPSEVEEALKEIDEAINLEPNNFNYHLKKGEILEDLKRFEEALKEADAAISLDPEDPNTYDLKGHILEDMGRFRESAEMYNKAIALDLGYEDLHLDRLRALYNAGMYEEALEEADILIGLDPDSDNYHYNRANILEKLGRYEEALREYETACKAHRFFYGRFFGEYCIRKAMLLAKLGRCRDALKEVAKIEEYCRSYSDECNTIIKMCDNAK